jgi:hypothetical protein
MEEEDELIAVMCDICDKWRNVPESSVDFDGDWFCDMAVSGGCDTKTRACDVEQQRLDEEKRLRRKREREEIERQREEEEQIRVAQIRSKMPKWQSFDIKELKQEVRERGYHPVSAKKSALVDQLEALYEDNVPKIVGASTFNDARGKFSPYFFLIIMFS